MAVFKNDKPKGFPLFIKEFRRSLKAAGGISMSRSISYPSLHILREIRFKFDPLTKKSRASTNYNSEEIIQVLGKFSANALSKKKCTVRRLIIKLYQNNDRIPTE